MFPNRVSRDNNALGGGGVIIDLIASEQIPKGSNSTMARETKELV